MNRPIKNRKIARKHHFVPRGYLAGFTDDGTIDGRLSVLDVISRSIFQTNPGNVGAERDFNRIDVTGKDPDDLERALGEFEGRAISVMREIQASGKLPPDKELNYVLNLMALIVIRNPRMRKTMAAAMSQTTRIISDLLASDKKL